MKVRDVALKAPVTMPIDGTIQQAAAAMDAAAVGAVVVVDDDGRPVGVVTDRDLVVRALARNAPANARVDGVMSSGVVCVDADADLRDAVEVLSTHAFRRVPAVSGDSVVGMVTLDDLVVRLANDLYEVTKGVFAQLAFGHPEPRSPAVVD